MKNKMLNILITNIGRRNYLVDFLRNASSLRGKIYVSDCDETAAGLYSDCDGYFILPKPVVNEEKYVQELLNLCEKKRIGLIIPVIDPEIYILAKYKERFDQANIYVLVSSKNVLETCYNKHFMNDFLQSIGLAVPRTYYDVKSFISDYEAHNISFPVIIKPIYGSGSVGNQMISSVLQLEIVFSEGYMIQEYVCGEEYGVDSFLNEENQPVRLIIKKKLSMRSGETDKAVTVYDKNIKEEVLKMLKELKGVGPVDCDVIQSANGTCYIIDVNPRLGGGNPATYAAGVNFAELAIRLALKKKISPLFDNYKEGILTMKTIKIISVQMGEQCGSVCGNIAKDII